MNLQSMIIGSLALIGVLPMMIFPRRKRLKAEAIISQRINDLSNGAEERYFEERRAIEAYPPPKTDRGWLIRGALLSFAGLVLISLSVIPHP